MAVGTANFYEPQTALQVIDGLGDFMRRHGIEEARSSGVSESRNAPESASCRLIHPALGWGDQRAALVRELRLPHQLDVTRGSLDKGERLTTLL